MANLLTRSNLASLCLTEKAENAITYKLKKAVLRKFSQDRFRINSPKGNYEVYRAKNT
jgi:hypothetical protein